MNEKNTFDIGIIIPIVSALIIFLGYTHLEVYYSMFNIDIYNYVDTSEILLSFYPAIKIFLLSGFIMFTLTRLIHSNNYLRHLFALEGLKFEMIKRAKVKFYIAKRKNGLLQKIFYIIYFLICRFIEYVFQIISIITVIFVTIYTVRGTLIYQFLEMARRPDEQIATIIIGGACLLLILLMVMRWCVKFLITIFKITDKLYSNILVYCMVFLFVDLTYNAFRYSQVVFHETPDTIYHFKNFVINTSSDTVLLGQTNKYLFFFTSVEQDEPELPDQIFIFRRKKTIVIKKEELETIESIF